jgi:transposase
MGLVKRYIAKMSGLSRAQVTRLIGRYCESGEVKVKRGLRHRFAARYSKADIELLALADEAHDTLSGPAMQRIFYRDFHEFADVRFERLAVISVAHTYNLRKRRAYREKRMNFAKTKPTQVSIGERRRPEPEGRPGYLRVDTVHQGDEGRLLCQRRRRGHAMAGGGSDRADLRGVVNARAGRNTGTVSFSDPRVPLR